MHQTEQMDEAETPGEGQGEGGLLSMLTEAARELEAVRGHRRGGPGRGGGGATEGGLGEGMLSSAHGEEEEGCMQKVLGALRELSVSHSDRVAEWREAVGECARMLAECPPEGSVQQHPPTTDTECKVLPCSVSLSDTFISVGEDIQDVVDKLDTVITKLDKEILRLRQKGASAAGAELRETRAPKASEECEDVTNFSSHDPPRFDCRPKQNVEDGDRAPGSLDKEQASDSRFCISFRNDEEEKEEGKEVSQGCDDQNVEETNKEWIVVGLTGHQEDRRSDVPDACFIRAAPGVAKVLRCEVADALSCLMVTGAEELVSRVIRVKVQDGARLHFPVTVVVPFRARYRGSCRDIAVKTMDGEGRMSYVTPVTSEGMYGGQRGSFAEARVYSLGLFAVISCLKRENYTVPTKGLSLKLSMDPRISLNYPPGSFVAPVMAQTMIQPVDAALLAAVRSRLDVYHSVVSTSPLLYLTHPSSQPLRRSLAVTLPCPLNPENKRHTKGQGALGEVPHHTGPFGAPPSQDRPASHRRTVVAPLKSKRRPDELLTALGSRDNRWSVLDKVTVRNLQNGLASFELTEYFERLLVVRLLSPLQPCRLTSLAEELEESVCRHAVTVVLQRRPGEPHAVLVAALPSRDLSWELSQLGAQGYGGPRDASCEISMCEGDQLVLHFSGNITSTSDPPQHRLTFHSQLKNELRLCLTEVDPFGNYSSPHYKGTAIFYKVPRGQLRCQGDGAERTDKKPPGDPACKLSLTLPKKERTISRPVAARVKLCEETDSLSDSLLLWLSGELSEEDVALLVLALRLRRSAAQLVKLRAGDSVSTQAFHVLATWRRGLPAAPRRSKASLLACCLAKSGRPDLGRELLLRQAAATKQDPLKQDTQISWR